MTEVATNMVSRQDTLTKLHIQKIIFGGPNCNKSNISMKANTFLLLFTYISNQRVKLTVIPPH